MNGDYRACTPGKLLKQTLIELMNEKEISTKDANKIMDLFDESFAESMKEIVDNNRMKDIDCSITGNINMYNCIEGNWQMQGDIKLDVMKESTTIPAKVLFRENKE